MYDAIVIGARCAGSPTAMLLARKGYRVLLLDKAGFPSDTLSTHIVWPHGAELLNRWGLLDRLAATGCPPIARRMIFDLGPFALRGAVTDANAGRGGFCPRRTVLDKLLVDAAAAAGAELRERVAVEELTWDGNRVCGIKARTAAGASLAERARVVIGADGVHSLVARAVHAREYDVKPPIATYYYSYYSGYQADDIEQYVRPQQGAGFFPTHDGLTLVAGVWPNRKFPSIREDIEGHFRKLHESAPSAAERLRRAQRVDKWFGTAGVANYFRKPYGSGWALVGDAGYDKDPLTAQGISDAFVDAESLSVALDEAWCERRSFDDSLHDHHSRRDRRVKPMYDFTCQLALLEPPPPHLQELFAALNGNQQATNDFYAALTGAVPLPTFMNPENVARIIAQSQPEVSGRLV